MGLPKYPEGAGHKGGDTSSDAALQIESGSRAETLRSQVLQLFAASPDGMTADECAASLGEDLLSIRPRVTELKLRGLLSDSGQRRPTRYGRSQRVMVHYIHD